MDSLLYTTVPKVHKENRLNDFLTSIIAYL